MVNFLKIWFQEDRAKASLFTVYLYIILKIVAVEYEENNTYSADLEENKKATLTRFNIDSVIKFYPIWSWKIELWIYALVLGYDESVLMLYSTRS